MKVNLVQFKIREGYKKARQRDKENLKKQHRVDRQYEPVNGRRHSGIVVQPEVSISSPQSNR